MLQYDLSNTILMHSDDPGSVPTEGELLAVLIGLLFQEGCDFEELHNRPLNLTEQNRENVARFIELHALPLTRGRCSPECLRSRLAQLVGLRIEQG